MMNCDCDCDEKKGCRCRLACNKKKRQILSVAFRDRRRLDWILWIGLNLNWIACSD